MIFGAVYCQVSLEGNETIFVGSFPFAKGQQLNKLYWRYKPVRIQPAKKNLLIWNSETTQNLNIYLHNYETETAIFLATKHEKAVMACNYLNFSKYIKTAKNGGFCEELLCENNFEAVLVNFCCYEYGANVSEAV